MTKRSTATKNNVFHTFVTLGPIGYLPYAPGTYGSALACVLLYFLPSVFAHPLFVFIFIVVTLIVLNNLAFEGKDPRYIIIDEVAGMFVTMTGHNITLFSLLAGFVLFRFFDIKKPYPIKRVETLRQGYGIVGDDVVAGVFANIIIIIGERILT